MKNVKKIVVATTVAVLIILSAGTANAHSRFFFGLSIAPPVVVAPPPVAVYPYPYYYPRYYYGRSYYYDPYCGCYRYYYHYPRHYRYDHDYDDSYQRRD